uniref:UBC core domain-containing protein n=1 Tax=viral metagenome TaxID=1070528 RepID=A0A6C0LM82_9ZZZZ
MTSLARRIDGQFKKVLKDNNNYYTCCIDLDNPLVWYVLIKNLPEPYIDGEYYFKLKLPKDFPDNPPEFEALTPNGLISLGGNVCVSIGIYHRNDHSRSSSRGHFGWQPCLGISGFILQGIINALLSFGDSDHGVRLNNMSDVVKKELAKKSKDYNSEKNKEVKDLFRIHREMFSDLNVWKES